MCSDHLHTKITSKSWFAFYFRGKLHYENAFASSAYTWIQTNHSQTKSPCQAKFKVPEANLITLGFKKLMRVMPNFTEQSWGNSRNFTGLFCERGANGLKFGVLLIHTVPIFFCSCFKVQLKGVQNKIALCLQKACST